VALVISGTEEIAEGVNVTRPRQTARGRFTSINWWGTSEDVGRAVAILAAADLSVMVGAAIAVDGGMYITVTDERADDRQVTRPRNR